MEIFTIGFRRRLRGKTRSGSVALLDAEFLDTD